MIDNDHVESELSETVEYLRNGQVIEEGHALPDLAKIRKVLDAIDAEPEAWDQRWWEFNWDADVNAEYYRSTQGNVPTCGTTRCFAGHVQYMDLGYVQPADVFQHGMQSLGLTYDEASALFHSTSDFTGKDDQRAAIQLVCEVIAERAGERL